MNFAAFISLGHYYIRSPSFGRTDELLYKAVSAAAVLTGHQLTGLTFRHRASSLYDRRFDLSRERFLYIYSTNIFHYVSLI